MCNAAIAVFNAIWESKFYYIKNLAILQLYNKRWISLQEIKVDANNCTISVLEIILHSAACCVLKLKFSQISLIQAMKEKNAYYSMDRFHLNIYRYHHWELKYQNKVSIKKECVCVLRKCKGVMVIQLSERMSKCFVK